MTATDGGTPPKSATASVTVVIQDVNDNDPSFQPPQYEVELAEDEPPGTPVVTVTATDADEDNRWGLTTVFTTYKRPQLTPSDLSVAYLLCAEHG